MRVAIFGLGYVGSVTAACLAAAGHDVVGVDVDEHKLSLIRSGRSPINEPGLDGLLSRMVNDGRVTVTSDTAAAVGSCDVSLLCVGTPSRRNGSLESVYLERVIEHIGAALATSDAYHVVAIRSTLLPGVLASRLIPLLERTSGRRVGDTIGVCVNPEFLREGSAIADFEKPPFTVIGETDERAGTRLLSIYEHLNAPVHRLRPDEASMVKYASNNFHALKVAFANEIGAIARELQIDGQQVMRVFCEDRELNISRRYLRPGFGFGGSCLPKDLRAVVYVAKEHDLTTPLLGSVLASNDAHIQRVVDEVLARGRKRVALLGLSFKVGSDDLRESPFVRLAEELIGKGVPLRIHDPDVALSDVFGRNRAYIDEHLPHVGQLVVRDLDDVLADADLVIVGKRLRGIADLRSRLRADQVLIDLVGIPELEMAIRPWAADALPLPAQKAVGPARSGR
jgi:GDP-mannose 6-dehydrogenase